MKTKIKHIFRFILAKLRINRRVLTILIAGFAFILVISGAVIIFRALFPKNDRGVTLKLIPESQSAVVGAPFTITLFLSSKNVVVTSCDAVVAYDPDYLRLDEIKTTDMFPVYPRKLIEDFKNRFIVTGIQNSVKHLLQGPVGDLARITATPLKSGRTELLFLIKGNRYTNVLDEQEINVLKKVINLEIEIKE